MSGPDPADRRTPDVADEREHLLVSTFDELSDTLIHDFDLVDFLHMLTERCVALLDIAECGLLLTDAAGKLNVMAASNEATHILELFQLQNHEGPCLEAFGTGRPVGSDDLEADRDRWPRFVTAALDTGFRSVLALPMRWRGQTIGALNLFSANTGRLSSRDQYLGQAMANVASIGLLNGRAIRESQLLAEQLQTALHSRITLEQAKGMLAERADVAPDEAFRMMRSYSRANNERVSAVAEAVIAGDLDLERLLAAR